MISSTERSETRKILDLILFNPFHYIAGIKAMIAGIFIILITGYLAFLSDCRFIGLISLTYKQPSAFLNCMLDGLISWLIISLLLLIAGKIISKSRFRIVDVIGTQSLARFPFLIVALITLIPGIINATARYQLKLSSLENLTDLISADLIPFVVFIGMYILMTVWMIVLMYRAFSVSCNITGKKAVFGFGICFIIGIIISQIVINRVPAKPENQAQVTAQKIDFEYKVHELISLSASNKFNEAADMFDDDMKSIFSVEEMKAGWADVISRFGSFKNHGKVLITERGNYTVCDVICYYEKGWMHYKYVFDENGKISRAEIR